MAEYIEREALLKKAIEGKRFVFRMEDLLNNEVVFQTVYKDLAEFIFSVPAADVVEVVRCKDCRRGFKKYIGNNACVECSLFRYDDTRQYKDYMDFCSHGVRRESDAAD